MDMIKINYSKRNIHIISFFISLIIFLLIVYSLKFLSLKFKQNPKQNLIETTNNVNNIGNEDISLQEIQKWQIEIEKLNLVAEIKEGISEEVIKENVGHFTTSSLLYGNIILKAYNTGEYKNYFANLKELEQGDEVKYIINNTENIYKVVSNIIIDNEEEYVSEKIANSKNTLTLITYIKDMPDKRRCVITEKKGEK